jgi:hypothetical protein
MGGVTLVPQREWGTGSSFLRGKPVGEGPQQEKSIKNTFRVHEGSPTTQQGNGGGMGDKGGSFPSWATAFHLTELLANSLLAQTVRLLNPQQGQDFTQAL